MQILLDKILILRFGPIFDMISDIEVTFSSSMPFNKDVRYSYSIDGDNFSNWFDNIDDFLMAYKEVLFIKNATYVRVRIEAAKYNEKEDLKDQVTEDLGWDTKIDCTVKINGVEREPDSYEIINPGEFVVKNPQGLWSPYPHMEKAYKIWKDGAEAINQMFGHWVYYFNTTPNQEDKAILFKQYTLHNVTGMKLIKVSVPGNNMPSGRNQYSEFGITLPDEFNIQILTEPFQRAFGYNAIPNENDYLYMPITGKMYSVAAIYETKQFMQKSVMYEAVLQIYSKAENVDDSNFSFEELINTFPNGADTQNELDAIDVSAKDYMNLTICEQYRKYIHKALQIVTWDFSVNGVDLFNTAYDLSRVPRNELAVSYNCKFSVNEVSTSQNIALSFWCNFQKRPLSGKLFEILRTNNTGSQVAFATIAIEQRNLIIRCNNKELISENKLEQGIYAFAISISGQYNVLMLTIEKYDAQEGGFTTITDTYIQIGTIKAPISGLSLYATPCLISNISLDEHLIETDQFINYLTKVFPDEDNVIFDKAQRSVPDVPFNM